MQRMIGERDGAAFGGGAGERLQCGRLDGDVRERLKCQSFAERGEVDTDLRREEGEELAFVELLRR